MPGLSKDQIAAYQKDMYAFEMEAVEQEKQVHPEIFKVESDGVHSFGLGQKATQRLSAGELKQHSSEGESIDFKTPVSGWETYTAYQEFSDGLNFSKIAVDRTNPEKVANMLKELATSWGISVAVEKETYSATVFNEGGTLAGNAVFNGTSQDLTDSSGNLLYDSVPFFALSGNNHVPKGGGTGYFNSVAGLTLTPANFETIYNRHTATNNRDERNRVVRNPADTLLTTTGADALEAVRILESVQEPSSQNNDVNVYSRLGIMPIAWDYLTDVASNGGFYVGKRQTDELQFINAQEEEIRFSRDEDNLGYKASIHLMFSVWLKAGVWKRWTRGGGSSS